MIQNISSYQTKNPVRSLKFGQSVPATQPQKDKAETAATSKDSNVLMTILMLGGASAAGVLGHKLYVDKAKKGASGVAGSAAETFYKIVPKDFDKTALHAKFVESKKSILGFIQDSQEKPEAIKEFLFGVTSHPEKSQEFVKEVTQDPRQSQSIVKTLVQKIGGQKNFVDWYFAPQGYQKAYSRHIEKFAESAQNPETLFKQSPNWHYHVLNRKFGEDFTVGQIPKAFGDKDSYRDIFIRLLTMPEGEVAPGIKKMKNFSEGLSSKIVYMVEADGKKYIMKINVNTGNSCYEHNENALMKSDSTFIDAQIDFYLKSNSNQNVAGIHFYDNKTKSSLYEFVEGEPLHEQVSLPQLNAKVADMNQLGIISNDVKPANYRQLNDTVKGIDSGESSYIDVLRPCCENYHFVLPNWSGKDLSSCLAGMNMDKI